MSKVMLSDIPNLIEACQVNLHALKRKTPRNAGNYR